LRVACMPPEFPFVKHEKRELVAEKAFFLFSNLREGKDAIGKQKPAHGQAGANECAAPAVAISGKGAVCEGPAANCSGDLRQPDFGINASAFLELLQSRLR